VINWLKLQYSTRQKDELNFNEWDALSDRRKKSKLKTIISQVEDDVMPISSYTFIHKDAKLSKSEKILIIGFMKNIKDNLE